LQSNDLALWTIYNFPPKTSIYNVKREYRAMPVPVLGDAVPVLVLVLKRVIEASV